MMYAGLTSMYEVDDKDKVVKLSHVPEPEAGAPMPVVLAKQGTTVLALL